MRPLKIGLDMDGVLCDFYSSYIKRFGVPKTPYTIPKNIHRYLTNDKKFWLNIPVMNIPNFIPELVCTARINNKAWNKEYLQEKFGLNVPIYQVPGYTISKAPRIKGRVDVFVDNSLENFIDLNLNEIPCLLFVDKKTLLASKSLVYPGIITSLNYDGIESAYGQLLYFNKQFFIDHINEYKHIIG